MDYYLLMFVLTGALISDASAQTRLFYFVNMSLSWTDAQSFCREFYTDLATIDSTDDVSAVMNTTSNYTGKAWIGLHDDLNSWTWSLNDSSFYGEGGMEFRNWQTGQPNNLMGNQYCADLLNTGLWLDDYCYLQLYFICYNGTISGSASYVKVNTAKNWTDAQTYCRENYVDLASVRNLTENSILTNLAAGNTVWIGLHRDLVWSDGTTTVFRYWVGSQTVSDGAHCVTTSFSDSGHWSEDSCTQSFPFICYTTTPPNAGNFAAAAQNETSITLQWSQVKDGISFILQFNGTETNITAPVGGGSVTHTVSSLTAGTEYAFTLFSLFDNVRSSGVTITAATAPANVESFRAIGQSQTSITLQWTQSNSNSFILQFNGTETNITAPVGGGSVTQTVSSLTAGTEYTFTLFSVFDNIRSSGVTITAATANPQNSIVVLNMKLASSSQLSFSDIDKILKQYISFPSKLLSVNGKTV